MSLIKRIVVISEGPTFLSVENRQLVVKQSGEVRARVPLEDIGALVIDQIATTYTHAVLAGLAELGATVVVCGGKHLPVGVLWPQESNDLTGRRIRLQAAVPLPLRKTLWKQIVRRKIYLQANNLPAEHRVRRKLLMMIRQVRSGDASNLEGQAARLYFPALFGEDFRRDQDSFDPPNNLLNYGYIVMRSLVGRALVAAGLHPALSLHHRHRNNAFALADDLMEPLRPLVDYTVRRHWRANPEETELTQDAKRALLSLATYPVTLGKRDHETGPLLVQLHRVCTSLVRCYEASAERKNARASTQAPLQTPSQAAPSPDASSLPPSPLKSPLSDDLSSEPDDGESSVTGSSSRKIGAHRTDLVRLDLPLYFTQTRGGSGLSEEEGEE